MIRKLIASSIMAIAASGAASAGEPSPSLAELTALSVGRFTTLEQAKRDARYGVAEAEIVRIWPERDDGVWTYQEQAFLGDSAGKIDATAKARPYFARVIHSVEIAPGIVERRVRRVKNPALAIGAWRSAAPLNDLSPDDLEPSECAIIATRIAEKMWRSESVRCPNGYKGAAYALSLGVIVDGRYANWDRGFDSNDQRVWGPEGGGYIFERREMTQ
jgi:hypothetical protein